MSHCDSVLWKTVCYLCLTRFCVLKKTEALRLVAERLAAFFCLSDMYFTTATNMMLCEIFHCRWRQLVPSAVGAVVEQGGNQVYLSAAKVGEILDCVGFQLCSSQKANFHLPTKVQ